MTRAYAPLRRLPLLALAVAALALLALLAPLAAEAATPGTPDSVTVARSNGALTATWDAVDGATHYHVTYSSDNGASWSLAALEHPSNSIEITGVDNAETYIVGVRAKNGDDGGTWRNSDPAGPYVLPQPPDAVASVAVTRADGSLTASWDAVDGATHYHVTYTSDNGASWSLAALEHPSSSITVTGLTNSATYVVGVRAGNDGGWSGTWRNSPASGPFVPPPTPTPTPTPAPAPSVTAERGDDGVSASVTWTAYAGDDFSYYRVVVCTDAQYDGSSCSGTVHKSAPVYDAASTGPVSVTGLEGATGYGVILQTWRTGGALKSHAAIPAVPAPSDAPSNFTVTNGDGYYDLDWDAVSGATAYDVRAKISNSNSWSSIATGVTATSYRYTTSNVVNVLAVRGRNAGGAGPWAELSRMPSNDWLNVVITGGASAQSAQGQSQLAAPASITVTRDNSPDDEQLNVSWDAVTGAGGYNLACAASPPSNTPFSSVSWWHCGSVDSGSTTTFTVDKDKRGGNDQDLSIWRSYAVAVRAVTTNPSQASPWLLSAEAHPARVPERETMSVSRATGSVSVSWTPPNHAQGYEIECAAYDLTETPQGAPSNEPSYTLCADVETATVTNGRISVTISSWTAGGTGYTVDDTKTYDLKVRTTNTWGESPDALAPLIYPDDMLTVSDIGVTTATLNIAHYSGNWYYKADRGPHTRCQSAVSGSTKALTGLTAHTNYVYSAYSNSRCSARRLLDTASFTAGSSVSNLTNAVAGDSDISRASKKAIAFTTGSNSSGYVLKSLTAKLKQKGSPFGNLTVKLHPMQGSGPYTKDSTPSSTVLATLSGTPPTSTSWTDTDYACSGSGCRLDPNTTYFIVADNDNGNSGSADVWVWAYTTSASEINTPTKNGWDIQYAHSYVGSNNWQSYEDWHVAELVFANAASLTASNVATTTATLTIANHTDVWYHKHTNAGATCDGPVAAGTSTKALTGLTAGTSYTFSAYSDSACTSANLLATASSFTTLASVSNLTSTKSGNSKIFNQLWQAVAFSTGPNSSGYVLKSVTLPLKNTGSSSGLTLTLRKMQGSGQYSATSVPTSTDLVTLTGTAPSGSDWTDTPFTCSGSGCDLSANTTYFVIASTTNLSADQFGWAWAAVETETETPAGTGWSVGYSHYLSTAYIDWKSHSDWNIAEFAFATNPSLDASNVTATGATLTIANHGAAWYYKHTNTGATCDGPVAAGTSTKALTTLTAGTSYTYSAYSDSTCTTGNLLATASSFTTPVSVSNLSQVFAGNTGVSNGNGKIYANQFHTGGNSGNYTLSEVTVDIGGKSGSIGALQVEVWSDSSGNPGSKVSGVTLSANDSTASSGQLAYTCSGACTLEANTDYWVRLSASGSGQWSWNYTSSGSETLEPTGNGWQIGDNKVLILVNNNHWGAANGYFKMKVEAIPNPSLDASSVTATGATLTISHHGGVAWYYKHTNTGATCDGPVAAGTSTKALTTLTAGTSYTYSAYSDSTCTTGNLLATAAQFTTLLASPTGVVASASKGGVSVTWTASGVDKAQVRTRTSASGGNQAGAWSGAVDPVVNADASPARIIGLTPGTAVDVQLRTVKGTKHSAWVDAGTSITPQAVTAPSGKAQNVNVSYASSKIWIRFDFPTDDGGQALQYQFSIDTGGNNINTTGAGVDTTAGAEADKTHSGTAYDVVYYFDRWRHPNVFSNNWTSICNSGYNFHVKKMSVLVKNTSGNSGWLNVNLSPYVYSGCD